MKKQLFYCSTIIVFLFTITISNGIKSANPSDDTPPNYNPIELKGKLDVNAGPSDIDAYADANTVYVVFHCNFGYVNITLYNELGLSVYSDVVDTSVQQTVIIPITGAPSGDYILVLENANGYAEGEFNKEP